MSWAEIGARVGQRNLSTTADTYTHVLMVYREIDRSNWGLETALETQSDEHQGGNRDSRDHERKARNSEKSAHVDETG